MAPSRLDRFKAAIKNDLDKLPDKPKPAAVTTPPAEDTSNTREPSTSTQIEDSRSITDAVPQSTIKMEHGQLTPDETSFSHLTIDDQAALDSDDSEAGCPIGIEPVGSDEEDTSQNSKKVNQAGMKPPQNTRLGPQMRFMEVTKSGEGFCPILPIAKYPYKYVPKAHSQAVASAFFDNGQFWSREWDLFYVWHLEPSDKPIVFVREEQFVDLLKDVAARFPTLNIGPRESYFRYIKLVTPFPNHPRLLPRYLGRCKSRDDYDKMLRYVPAQAPFTFPRGEPEPTRAPTDEDIADFNNVCESAIDLNRAKSKSKNKKREERVVIQGNLTKQLKRAQRYFGLTKQRSSKAEIVPPISVTEPPPYQLEEDVIIICVDLEAWERSHSIITEVGIATLDTRDIRNMAPGSLGENWREKIRARHFRINEHMIYENKDFVIGCPDRFEKDFGTTEFIDLKDACHAVASCFKEPFSKQLTQEEIDASWNKLSESGDNANDGKQEKRNIIFLGHNPASDVGYLRTLGYDPENLLNLREYMDTAGLYRAHKKEAQARGVGGILAEFGLTGWNLHNAGNDAVYTLWIMLATIVAEAESRRKKDEDDSDDEGEDGKPGIAKTTKTTANGASAPPMSIDDFVVPEEYKVW